ncbi:hypothetical protein R1flu_018583 [Riccia fluitans]|uniref:Phosphatase PP2A regulatory subunit A/Splicing factor 3B subunit 1-like HEAT repeat domain-containing protein n=1 Tax=Riccia fluitans TaxID=41844 RepID=A0ABD1ZGK8_9MARC
MVDNVDSRVYFVTEASLIGQMTQDDIKLWFRHLSSIAAVIGKERTRKGLIPFVSMSISGHEFEGEVLLTMAEKLDFFFLHVGDHSTMTCVMTVISYDVKRSAGSNLGKFAATVKTTNWKSDILTLLKDLSEDRLDSKDLSMLQSYSNLLIISNTFYLRFPVSHKTKNGGVETAIQHIFPCVKDLSTDSSQGVRAALASVIMGMAPLLGRENTMEHLLPVFLTLLKDESKDVHLNIIGGLDQAEEVIPNGCDLQEQFGTDWATQHIIPQLVDMINNPHYLYRIAVLSAISLLAPVVGPEATSPTLLPVVIKAGEDRVPNVRFNVAKVLQSIILVVDFTTVGEIMHPCLQELSQVPDRDVRYFANQEIQACGHVML